MAGKSKISALFPGINPKNKSKYITAAISLVVIILAIYFLFIYQSGPKKLKGDEGTGEIKNISEIELVNKPYVSMTPTSDGAEIIVSMENMSYFERIEYEVTYLADNPQVAGEKIQRGATGTDVNTKDEKYKKAILLGTASKGTRSPDRGITDGKLALHLFKGDGEYLSETEWNLFEIGSQQTAIADSQGKIEMQVPATLGKTYWVILADTVGFPKSFDKDPKTIITPIFGTFSIAPKFTKSANLSIKLDNDSQNLQLHLYSAQDEKWETKDVQAKDKTISTTINNFATFVITTE